MKKSILFLCLGLIFSWIPTANAADVAYSFSGQIRFRPEMYDNYDFDKDTDDKMAKIGQRIRLNVNAKVGDDIAHILFKVKGYIMMIFNK